MPVGLKIAFFGSSLVSAYWNGAATYYRGIIRALNERGHKVTFYEPDAYERQQHRDIPDPDWAKVVVYSGDDDDAAYEVLEEARDADLIVKASGVGVYDKLLEEGVLDLKRHNNIVAYWDVDAPATLDRVQSDRSDPFGRLIHKFDLVLTYGGGDPVAKTYELLGAKKCVPIYNAFDPSTHFCVDPDPRFTCDLALMANRLPDREDRIDEFFFRAAVQLPERHFILGGNGWQDKSMTSNVDYLGHVYTADHNAFNCSPLAVLNVARASMARYGFSPATRVFEAAGVGACMITDNWEGIDFFFEPDEEILVAEDGDEVAEALRSLTPEKAKTIGSAAQERVLSAHTYAHRVELLEEVINSSRTNTRGGVGLSK